MLKDFLNDTITLCQGDALTILHHLPSNSIDAVITDPPYSSGGTTLAAKQAAPASKYQTSGTRRTYPPMLGDAKDQRSWTTWCTLWLAECWRVARDGAPLLVFIDWRQLPSMTDALQAAGWSWLGIVPWNKRSSRPQLGKFRQQCEFVLFASKGRFAPASRKCLPGFYDYTVNAQQKIHLTSKPLQLMQDMLAITKPDATVLDPFMGGGTTGHACAVKDRGFVGIELSAEYYALAKARIENAAQSTAYQKCYNI